MTTMQTVTGQLVDLIEPHPETIKPADIAHHLALINRWNGATREPVSVARHSLLCYKIGGRIEDLLHDAPEAYMGDITSPVMQAMELVVSSRVKDFKNDFHRKVYGILGLYNLMDNLNYSKEADLGSMGCERQAFMVDTDWGWSPPVPKSVTWSLESWEQDRTDFAKTWCQLDKTLNFDRDFWFPWVDACAYQRTKELARWRIYDCREKIPDIGDEVYLFHSHTCRTLPYKKGVVSKVDPGGSNPYVIVRDSELLETPHITEYDVADHAYYWSPVDEVHL